MLSMSPACYFRRLRAGDVSSNGRMARQVRFFRIEAQDTERRNKLQGALTGWPPPSLFRMHLSPALISGDLNDYGFLRVTGKAFWK